MLRTRVERNALEISVSQTDAALMGVGVVLLGFLLLQAGWQVAALTLVLSVSFGAMISVVQHGSTDTPQRDL